MSKKKSGIKSAFKLFAVVASVGGVLYVFKDKIKESKILDNTEDNPLNKLKEKVCNTINNKDKFYDDEDDSVKESDEDFVDAFDEAHTKDREYVSINITSKQETESSDVSSDKTDSNKNNPLEDTSTKNSGSLDSYDTPVEKYENQGLSDYKQDSEDLEDLSKLDSVDSNEDPFGFNPDDLNK